MFGIGFTELLVILIVALLVFGPQRLPELARSLGKSLAEFRRASSELRQSLYDATDPARLPPERPAAPATASASSGALAAPGAAQETVAEAPAPAAQAREPSSPAEDAAAAPKGE